MNEQPGTEDESTRPAEATPVEHNPTEQPENKPDKPKSKKKRTLIALGLALLVALAGFNYYLFAKDSSATTQQTAATSKATQAPEPAQPVLCVGLGLRSMQCEALESGELRKYELPKDFGSIVRMLPNKTGDKIFANTYSQPTSDDVAATEAFTIYDLKLQELASLPSEPEEVNSSNLRDVNWLDDKSMVYTKRDGQTLRIYAFDIKSKQESLLLEADTTIERLMPSGDKTYIYAIQALVNPAKNRVERKLVLINTDTKTITDVANDVIDVDNQELAYDMNTSLFYASILQSAEQTFNTKTFEAVELTTSPKLKPVGQMNNLKYIVPYAHQITTTTAGILAQPGADYMARAPLRLYTDADTYKSLSLAVGTKNTFYLSLQDFPALKQSATGKPVVADFFQPASDIPQAIKTFVKNRATENTGCKPGEYKTYEIYRYDGETQFSLLEAGCETSGLAFYRKNNETYAKITSIREGMSCEQRDKLGISERVFPDCRGLGEGL